MATPARALETTVVPRPALRLVQPGERPPPRGRAAGPARRPRPASRARTPRRVPSPAVYRRRRLAVTALLAAVLGLGAWATGLGGGADVGAGASPGDPGSEQVRTIVVAPGDTVWDLVLPALPAGADPTAFAAEVAALNGVDDPRTLAPGSVLRLPPG